MVRLEPVDPFDEQLLRRWHDAYLAAHTEGRPFATPWMYDEVRAAAQAPAVSEERLLLALADGREVLGTGQAVLPLRENLDTADVRVHVVPRHRRRGHGTRLLAALEEHACDRHRRRISGLAEHAYPLGPDGRSDPGVEFGLARGFTVTLAHVQLSLSLPVPAGLLDRLAAEAAPRHEGYRLRSFSGPVPEELLGSWTRLVGLLASEAPTGAEDVEAERYDEERVRGDEDRLAAAGRRRHVAVALDAAGDVVAFTEVLVPTHHPGRAYQQGTLVHPDHRGHRLGVALKVLTHRLLGQRERSVGVVITYNAEVNAPMVAVNTLLGYRPTARIAELHKRLPPHHRQ